MPRAVEYKDPNDSERLDDFGAVNREMRDRADTYNKALNYYLGNHKKQLNVKPGQPDDNVVANLTQIAADRTVTFIFPASPIFELDPQESETTPTEQWLADAYEYNGGLALFQKMALVGYLSGQVYVRVRPPRNGELYPRLILLDPRNTITFWNVDDYREPLWHTTTWQEGETEYLLDVVNRGGSWELIQYYRERQTKWEIWETGFWDYPEGPIISWQHLPSPHDFYGQNEAKDFELQDSVNLLLGEMKRIVRYHASPRTVAVGVQAEDVLETAVDNMWAIDNPDAKVQNLEMQSELVATRELIALLQDIYLGTRRVVLLKGDVESFQRVTNTGIRTLYLDMLAKRAVLTRQYGYALRQMSLVLGVTGNQGELYPDVHFVDPLPIDAAEKAELELLLMENKVQSRQTTAVNLNRNWEDEVDKMTNEYELDFLKTPIELNTSEPVDNE